MMRVRILDDAVVNQIAAGEVIERPASVVKELVENSIDAGATEITVIIDNGGKSNIEVLDDGCGMTRDDALLAVERFGTSKIASLADLESIATLGFRGEALPSIASVSRFSLSTCADEPPGSPGVEVIIDGGKLRDVTETTLPRGTRVCVRQLFVNVPARRKFLRSDATECGMIKAILTDFCLSHPQLRIKLVTDGTEALLYPAVADFSARVRQIRIAGSQAVFVNTEKGTAAGVFRVSGALSHPVHAITGSSRLRLLVNNRTVRDRRLLRALRDAYGNFLKHGK